MIRLVTKSAEDTKELAGALAGLARAGDVLLMIGDLGTGKTTFAQGFGRALGVTEPITSPTFVLVRHYAGRLQMLHADVYRLDRLQEVVDLGLPELFDEESVALVEWGEVAAPALAPDFLEVRINLAGSSTGTAPSELSGLRSGPRQPASGQPGSGQPDSGQPDSGQPDSGQPGSGQPGSGQPDSGQPGSGHAVDERWISLHAVGRAWVERWVDLELAVDRWRPTGLPG